MHLLVDEKEEVLSTSQETTDHLYKTDALESEQTSLKEELSITADLIDDCVQENAHSALNQEEYNKRYDSLVERYTGLKNRYDEVTELIVQKRAGQQRMRLFLEQLKQTEHISEFDEMLWLSMIDYVTVYGKEDIRFTFKNGMEIAI